MRTQASKSTSTDTNRRTVAAHAGPRNHEIPTGALVGGHYRVLEVIGEGGMGRVYRATDLRLLREVALKMMLVGGDNWSALNQEARALALLNHPGIVTIHDVGVHHHAPYLVMEMVHGKTLRRRLAEARPSLLEALDWAMQILGALDAAHRRGIVHLDLKPENLLLTDDGILKVVDFGIAHLLRADDNEIRDARGTRQYMAPEQLLGHGVDARADLFAFGVVLFEMLTGSDPWVGPLVKAGPQTLREPPDGWPDPELEALIRRCLAPRREARPPSARYLLDALRVVHDAYANGLAMAPRCDLATSRGRLAYHVIGGRARGIDIVVVPGLLGVLDHAGTRPEAVRTLRHLARLGRVVVFDRLGMGASERVAESALPGLDDELEHLNLLLDAAGVDGCRLVALDEGAPLALLYAATRSSRVEAVALLGGGPSYGAGRDELLAEAEVWGAADRATGEWERTTASASTADAAIRHLVDVDVASVLPFVSCPVLAVQPASSPAPAPWTAALPRIEVAPIADAAPALTSLAPLAARRLAQFLAQRHDEPREFGLATWLITDAPRTQLPLRGRGELAGEHRGMAVLRYDRLGAALGDARAMLAAPDAPRIVLTCAAASSDATDLVDMHRHDVGATRPGALWLSPLAARLAQGAFVGRRHGRAVLERALVSSRRGPTAVVIRGESGIGKTALMRWFSERVAAIGGVVLAGRCHQRTPPFGAIAGVIDALADLCPDLAGPRGDDLRSLTGPASADPVAQRQRAVAALRDEVSTLARSWPLVIAIDDWNWVDRDSAVLLDELLRDERAPAVLMVVTTRGTAPTFPVPTELVDLQPLPPADAREMAAQLLERDDDAVSMVAEASGVPLFIAELAAHGETARGHNLDEALWRRVLRCGAAARSLLDVVAVAAAPIGAEIAAAAAGVPDDGAAVAELLEAGLIRVLPHAPADRLEPADHLEIDHERLREVIVHRLDAGARRARHLGIARALEARTPEVHEARGGHLRDGGDRAGALVQLRLAARQAAESLAFDRAVSLWRAVVELAPPPRPGPGDLSGLAEALAYAGRGSEAGDVFLEASAAAPRLLGHALEICGAEQLMHAGRIDAGLGAITRIAEALGVDGTEDASPSRIGRFVQRVRDDRRSLTWEAVPAQQRDPEVLVRADLCASAATGLMLVNAPRWRSFQRQHLDYALRSGDPYRVTRALYVETVHVALRPRRAPGRLAALGAATRAAAAQSDDPRARALVESAAASAAICDGQWREAATACDRGLAILQGSRGVSWERPQLQLGALMSLSFLGELGELSRRRRAYVADAEARGNHLALATFSLSTLVLDHLARDQPATARREAAERMVRWRAPGYGLHHARRLAGDVLTHLYEGDAAAAVARFADDANGVARSRIRDLAAVDIGLQELAARVAIVTGRPREADTGARRLGRTGRPWGVAMSTLIDALVASWQYGAHAIALLEDAEKRLRDLDMQLHASACRRHRGVLVGGVLGDALVAEADAWARGQGVLRPDRLAWAIAPWPGRDATWSAAFPIVTG